MLHDHLSVRPTAIRTQFGAIFVSLELSRSKWVLTSLSPVNGEKMSQYSLTAGDIGGLLARFAELIRKVRERTGSDYPIITIHEAGLDAFWVHRVLRDVGIESHVVDAASIATSRRRRRAIRTRSTVRRCCERCWPSSAASRGCAPWWLRLRLRKRIVAGFAASARRCSTRGSCTPTGSRGFCSRKVYPTTRRCGATFPSGLRACARYARPLLVHL